MKTIQALAVALLAVSLFSCGQKTSTNQPAAMPDSTMNIDSAMLVTPNDTLVPDMHTAENALDYYGIYKGTTPCADCPGIETVVTINPDRTFSYKMTYLDTNTKPFTEKGTWTIKGSYITLTYAGKEQRQQKIFVGENYLQLLDGDGKKITGALEKAYILKKVQQ